MQVLHAVFRRITGTNSKKGKQYVRRQAGSSKKRSPTVNPHVAPLLKNSVGFEWRFIKVIQVSSSVFLSLFAQFLLLSTVFGCVSCVCSIFLTLRFYFLKS